MVVTDRFHCICFRCLCQSCNVTMYIFQSCHLCYVIYTCDWPFALCITLAINTFHCNCHCYCHSLYPLMAGQHKVAYHNHISSNPYKIYVHNTTHLNTKRNGAHGEMFLDIYIIRIYMYIFTPTHTPTHTHIYIYIYIYGLVTWHRKYLIVVVLCQFTKSLDEVKRDHGDVLLEFITGRKTCHL